jgi:outer membrane receptor protein involved in Fe transport
MKLSSRSFASASALGVILALPGFAAAQGAVSSSTAGVELEEVVVTAEKRTTNLQTTPISIQVYQGEQLKAEGKKRIDDIMAGVVGVQVQTSQVGSNFFMRGVDSGAGGQTSVALLIDGVYQNRGEVVRGGTLDVSQVEVARGTQSTNLGASALAGSISIVSNQPAFTYSAQGTAEVGNFNLQNLEGVLNLPLTGSQALRVAYSSNKRDGYISSGAGDSDLQNVRLKYRFQATDNLNIVGTVSHQTIGGNGVTDGVLLSNGHWLPYNATLAAYSATNPNSSSPYAGLNFNGITSLTGANLGAGCAVSNIAGSNAARTGNAGVIMTLGCPAVFVAVRDGIYYYDRSNPWNDGLPQDAWPNDPFRHTTINDYSANIEWNTKIGTLTVTPSVEHAIFKSTEPPRGGWMSQNQLQDTRQAEARLASPAESTVQWLAGAYYYWTNTTGTFMNVVLPYSAGMAATTTSPLTAGCPYANATTAGTIVAPSPTTIVTTTTPNTELHDCYTWSNAQRNVQETKSAYVSGTYPLLDKRLRLIGGARYSQDEKDFVSVPDGSNPGDINGPYGAYDYSCSFLGTGFNPKSCQNGNSWSAWSYSYGAEYDVRPQSMVYAKYATGYAPGAVALIAQRKLTSQQITLGLKNRFLDNKMQVNVEAFDMTYHNRPLSGSLPVAILPGTVLGGSSNNCVGNTTPYRATINADGTGCLSLNTGGLSNFPAPVIPNLKSRGVDLEFNFLPTSHDRVDLSVEYLQSYYGDNPDILVPLPTIADITSTNSNSTTTAPTAQQAAILINQFTANLQAYKNLQLQASSKWSGNLSYQHEFQFSKGSSLTPRATAYYKSKYWSQSGSAASISLVNSALAYDHGRLNTDGTVNLAIQPAYTLYDASLAWRSSDGKIQATAYMHNIGDKAIMLNTNGTANVTLSNPRIFGVTLSGTLN